MEILRNLLQCCNSEMFVVFLVVTNTCMQVHVSGQPDKVCPATREEGVQSFDVRISKTKVPVEATYYVCQQFEVPHAAAYHAVAFEPIIDNKRVMHHMILYACDNDVAVQEGPHKCEENDLKCEKWLATWTLGLEGQICTHQNAGVRFGRGSVQRMALQVHWANTELNTGYFDSSGMRIYYTPKLRQYDLGNVQIGQTFLEIPPLSDRFEQHGGCSSDCSRRQLLHPVYFTKTNLHMHGAGVAGSLEQYRGGRLLNLIAYDPFYDNLKPHIHEHNPPIEVLPGDEIVLRCLYDTLSPGKMRVNTTSFGLGSDDEMCYAFVSHFPALPHFDRCIQYQDLDAGDCAPTKGWIGNCHVTSFLKSVASKIASEILFKCRPEHFCEQPCLTALVKLFGHECMQGDLTRYFTQNQLMAVEGWPDIVDIYNDVEKKC